MRSLDFGAVTQSYSGDIHCFVNAANPDLSQKFLTGALDDSGLMTANLSSNSTVPSPKAVIFCSNLLPVSSEEPKGQASMLAV
jgi:hypothetical protein